ncbi:MAG: hypothetical protein HKP21_01080 [Xanthomonadales bacterium]|nr:hypothetical protein [Gammaproteobacteria bacterium]NNK03118.1 hypothetical protein [Xanthomonadales bacterium]NNL00039.1 hypothetical protein [Xanthomonadales bacterium]
MMDMLKAYAHEVVSYHPATQRDDLYAEIYDELCESFSDAQTEEPKLSEAEFLNRTKEHPMKFATRLASVNSAYLIGPQLYFSFLQVLRIALSLVVVFHVIVGAVTALASGNIWSSFWRSFASIPESLLWVGACVFGVFVALERSGEKATWLDNWDAKSLKPVDSHQSISRFETAFDLGFSTYALLLILDVIDLPPAVFHNSEWIHDWAVNLPSWFWVLAGIMLAFDIGFSLYRLMRAHWSRNLRLVTIVSNVIWLGLLGYAVGQAELLTVAHESAREFLVFFERAAKGGLLVACAIIAWDTMTHVWRLRVGG